MLDDISQKLVVKIQLIYQSHGFYTSKDIH